VYFEVLTDGRAAARRERQVKKYGRVKKVALIEADNPQWKDLSAEFTKTFAL
jgi:putative endonuclease